MSTVHTDKNKVEISQNFVAFSEWTLTSTYLLTKVWTMTYVRGTTFTGLKKFELWITKFDFFFVKTIFEPNNFFDLQALLSIEFLCQKTVNNNNDSKNLVIPRKKSMR